MSFRDDFAHLRVQLKDISLATNEFRDKPIGIGGFGKVFKGELSLQDGKKMVAFKRLDRRWGQGDAEFWKEIMMLSQYKHENLISLLHFCDEDGERILVYEYASYGSLDRHLGKTSLTWNQLLKICHGAACGLNYLHHPIMHQRLLHRDVKSANILLNENLTAKISDFGLSKIGPANQQYTYLVSNAGGTPGYLDPMYFKTSSLSKESDVYSFGVVLFEVICGKYCYEYCNGELKILVPHWKKCYEEARIDDIVSNTLKEQMDMDSCKTFLDIAYRCLHDEQKARPTMAEIIKELEIALDQQELSQDADEIAKHKKRISLANKAATPISYRSRSELALIVSKGILLKGGYRRVSINKYGEYQEMLLLNKTNDNDIYHRYSDNFIFSLNANFQLQGRAMFLSAHVTYNINLVYEYWFNNNKKHVPLKYKLHTETEYWTSFVAQERSDKLLSTTLYQFTSLQREYDFKIDFLAQLRPVRDHYHYPDRRPTYPDQQDNKRCILRLIGVEFLPVEHEKDENLEEENKVDIQPAIDLDSYWKRKLPSGYDEIIKWSKYSLQWRTNKELYDLFRNGFLTNKSVEKWGTSEEIYHFLWEGFTLNIYDEQWFSASKHMKKRQMLPATAVLKNVPVLTSLLRRKPWIWKSLPESRFQLVAEFCEVESFTIACRIDSKLLSRHTNYACYLVYKLPENHSMVSGLVKIDDEGINKYVYEDGNVIWRDTKHIKEHLVDLLAPTHIPFIGCNVDESRIPVRTRKIKGHPKLRKDGWMEVQIWDFDASRYVYGGVFGMHCRVRTCYNWKLTGVLVQGIEFRPSKVCFRLV